MPLLDLKFNMITDCETVAKLWQNYPVPSVSMGFSPTSGSSVSD